MECIDCQFMLHDRNSNVCSFNQPTSLVSSYSGSSFVMAGLF